MRPMINALIMSISNTGVATCVPPVMTLLVRSWLRRGQPHNPYLQQSCMTTGEAPVTFVLTKQPARIGNKVKD